MKKCVCLFIFFTLIILISCKVNIEDMMPTQEPQSMITGKPCPIYVSIVSHNEAPPALDWPDFQTNTNAFWNHYDKIVEFAQMLHLRGAKYNFQSDWNFLLAIQQHASNGTPSTNNKNLLRYLKEDLGFEIDPHSHETTYNMAYVASLIDSLGVPVSHTVGGLLAAPPEHCKLEYFWTPIDHNNFFWQAEIIWGGATYFHVDEEELWISGIWKPMNNEKFLFHDDNAPLPHIGGFRPDWDGLTKLRKKQLSHELNPTRIHTQTIFVNQKWLFQPNFIQNFHQRIMALSLYTSVGLIKWVGLAEVVDIWNTQYNSQPNLYRYTDGKGKKPQKKIKKGDKRKKNKRRWIK